MLNARFSLQFLRQPASIGKAWALSDPYPPHIGSLVNSFHLTWSPVSDKQSGNVDLANPSFQMGTIQPRALKETSWHPLRQKLQARLPQAHQR
jgi:hypothetical protein